MRVELEVFRFAGALVEDVERLQLIDRRRYKFRLRLDVIVVVVWNRKQVDAIRDERACGREDIARCKSDMLHP